MINCSLVFFVLWTITLGGSGWKPLAFYKNRNSCEAAAYIVNVSLKDSAAICL